MLLSRDFVGYMANEVVKRLVANKMLEVGNRTVLAERIRVKMTEEISLEDRLNEEVREILSQHAEEMRRTGASYQEMYKKVKGELARQRKLILRSAHFARTRRTPSEPFAQHYAIKPGKNRTSVPQHYR